jgi:hypothetical protein
VDEAIDDVGGHLAEVRVSGAQERDDLVKSVEIPSAYVARAEVDGFVRGVTTGAGLGLRWMPIG